MPKPRTLPTTTRNGWIRTPCSELLRALSPDTYIAYDTNVTSHTRDDPIASHTDPGGPLRQKPCLEAFSFPRKPRAHESTAPPQPSLGVWHQTYSRVVCVGFRDCRCLPSHATTIDGGKELGVGSTLCVDRIGGRVVACVVSRSVYDPFARTTRVRHTVSCF